MSNTCNNKLMISGPPADRRRLIKVWTGERVFQKILPEPTEYTKDIIYDLMHTDAVKLLMRCSMLLDGNSKSMEEHMEGVLYEVFRDPGDYWTLEHWGTSDLGVDDYHISEDGTEIYFDTAWSPAVPVIQAMSRQYPTLTISLKYFIPNACCGGEAMFMAGEMEIHHYNNDDNYRRIAAEFGYEEEEEEYEEINETVPWQTEGF